MTVASFEGASATTGAHTATSFGDRLADRVAERESQIVLGLDPDPTRLWPNALAASGERSAGEHSAAEGSPAEGLAGRGSAGESALDDAQRDQLRDASR